MKTKLAFICLLFLFNLGGVAAQQRLLIYDSLSQTTATLNVDQKITFKLKGDEQYYNGKVDEISVKGIVINQKLVEFDQLEMIKFADRTEQKKKHKIVTIVTLSAVAIGAIYLLSLNDPEVYAATPILILAAIPLVAAVLIVDKTVRYGLVLDKEYYPGQHCRIVNAH